MSVLDPWLGRVLGGRYRIEQKLGSGDSTTTYLAEDLKLGRRVALKMLDERRAQDEQFVERYRRGAKDAARLLHPNIVRIYDRGEADGAYYLATEYLEGRTLEQLLAAHGPTPIPVAIEYTRQVLAALAFAHRNGVVHGEIEPHNIMVGRDGRLKLMDFATGSSGSERAERAAAGQRADLHSVGVVLYEMLTGERPSATVAPPSAPRPEVPRELDLIVLRALDDRGYRSADEMEAELARLGDGSPPARQEGEETILLPRQEAPARRAAPFVAATPPAAERPDDADRRVRRRGRALWGRLLALLALILVAGFGYYLYSKLERHHSAPPVTATTTAPVVAAVPLVVGEKETAAVATIRNAGFQARVRRLVDTATKVGDVFAQDPPAGAKTDEGEVVTIRVALAPPKVAVPKLVGKPGYDATAALVLAHLAYKVTQVHSLKPIGVVTGQAPRPRTRIVEGTVVRINVSQGPAKVAVPAVAGIPFSQASSQLHAAHLVAARVDVEASEPKETVVAESPAAKTTLPTGSTVTLSVSKGPQLRAVPDVRTSPEQSAIAKLAGSGFTAGIRFLDTRTKAQDGTVLHQTPPAKTLAKRGSRVVLVVARYHAPPPITPPTSTQQPPPTPTPPPPPATTPTAPTTHTTPATHTTPTTTTIPTTTSAPPSTTPPTTTAPAPVPAPTTTPP